MTVLQFAGRINGYRARIRYEVWCRKQRLFGRAIVYGAKGVLGCKVRVLGPVGLNFGARIGIRDGVVFGGCGQITVGEATAINEGCIITAMEHVEIGANVMLAPRVYVLDVDHKFDRRDVPISKQGYVVRPVKIEDDVWIGAGAVITRGVTIGRGAVVGANSVVTRDVPAFSIVAGLPAKVLKERPE